MRCCFIYTSCPHAPFGYFLYLIHQEYHRLISLEFGYQLDKLAECFCFFWNSFVFKIDIDTQFFSIFLGKIKKSKCFAYPSETNDRQNFAHVWIKIRHEGNITRFYIRQWIIPPIFDYIFQKESEFTFAEFVKKIEKEID